jgi:hypothetical protein
MTIWNSLALDSQFRVEITACTSVISEQLRHYYECFKILADTRKSLQQQQGAHGHAVCDLCCKGKRAPYTASSVEIPASLSCVDHCRQK